MGIEDIRRDYTRGTFNEQTAHEMPHEQFLQWFNDVLNDDSLTDPTAMVVASYEEESGISQRVVLLKGSTPEGYVFFTNYQSRKAQALLTQPRCSLHFSWLHAERQIAIEGIARPLSDEENDRYFASRPRASQLGAWASHQSEPIANREALESAFQSAEARFQNEETVPRPEYWGGFRVEPTRYEFWQGGAARLHDRVEYLRNSKGAWFKQRLQP
ncbi:MULTISPECIES: pyridoxamine 5'-phosphate oxidase [Gammaproteobacteria]|uniref:pyridoxamine 5'-phosphate oxidase n=1 Tax=Gammaproteobacteria TaxID=1236 RepID=UPI000DCF8556|nr:MULTISPECIES: pyridoxamine 5'-phosphate oxidase [Gammaproteobacteria]RTE85468.1 pyridoxamine 5'-phosphate oxidase [Aliidiomarina sp. B3213]TCZ89435.1 pyridoxamine 5'-phosphate oxidase [Lysobacter sp. N42]